MLPVPVVGHNISIGCWRLVFRRLDGPAEGALECELRDVVFGDNARFGVCNVWGHETIVDRKSRVLFEHGKPRGKNRLPSLGKLFD